MAGLSGVDSEPSLAFYCTAVLSQHSMLETIQQTERATSEVNLYGKANLASFVPLFQPQGSTTQQWPLCVQNILHEGANIWLSI